MVPPLCTGAYCRYAGVVRAALGPRASIVAGKDDATTRSLVATRKQVVRHVCCVMSVVIWVTAFRQRSFFHFISMKRVLFTKAVAHLCHHCEYCLAHRTCPSSLVTQQSACILNLVRYRDESGSRISIHSVRKILDRRFPFLHIRLLVEHHGINMRITVR